MSTPRRILVVAFPGIGDVLLATPLIRSLRLTYPEATIDLITREKCTDIVSGNPDISQVISYNYRSTIGSYLHPLSALFRRYDLSISTSTSDRGFVFNLCASSRRAGIVPALSLESFWKRVVTQVYYEEDQHTHKIIQNLRLGEKLGLVRNTEVVLPRRVANSSSNGYKSWLPGTPKEYAIVHIFSGRDYKLWPLAKWQLVIEELLGNGLDVVLTGGNDPREVTSLEDLAANFSPSVFSIAGKASFPELVEVLSAAKLYLGSDTSTTHVAAAAGIPTLVIFGPSSATVWGPWPKGYDLDIPPFKDEPGVQTNRNVTLIKPNCLCPNFKRTCRQHDLPTSLCMERLPVEDVLSVLRQHIKDGLSSHVSQALNTQH